MNPLIRSDINQEHEERFSRRCYRCGSPFVVVGAVFSSTKRSLTCSDPCRTATNRARKRFRLLAVAVACLFEGEPIEYAPEFWGLFRAMVDRERAIIRAARKSRRLPGGSHDHR